jgi:hypothetical protein
LGRDVTEASVPEVLAWCAAAWRQLCDLELAGRVMVTFMRSHMAEVAATMSYLDYFRTFYSPLAAEFVQADDDGFVTHHCLRTLHRVWHEEMRCLGLPLSDAPVRPGRAALAAAWYDDIEQTVNKNAPLEPISGNPVLAPEACVLAGRPELFFAQFLLYSTETWARQVVVLWRAVRAAIMLRRLPVHDLPDHAEHWTALVSAHADWQAVHRTSVDIHDAIPRNDIYGAIGRWLAELGPQSTGWTIKDAMKTEMYREVASSIASLRGEPIGVELPPFRYWRRTPWTPACLQPGQPGLPPF